MAKKNILETNDYQKMILEFNTKATEYENYKRNTIKSLSNERLAQTQKFLNNKLKTFHTIWPI